MKEEIRVEAIKLRKKGWSYPRIQKVFNVSRSTLSLWLRDVRLTQRQINKLVNNSRSVLYREAKARQKRRIELTKQIINRAKDEYRMLERSTLFIAGLMLYWAEGAKTLERVKFTNSDPAMISFMMRWFRNFCQVPERRFRIGLHIHELHCRKDIEKFWSRIVRIPLNQFHKTYIKPTSLKHRKKPLYNGTCSVSISDRNLFRKMLGWQIAFLDNVDSMPP